MGIDDFIHAVSDEEIADNDKFKFRLNHAADLINNFKPAPWLIKGYLEHECLASIVSEPGGYKTFVALEMGFCIASAKSWHGNLIKMPGTVIYVCGEGRNGLARRLRALEIHHDIKTDGIPLFVSSRPAAFLDKAGALEVVAAIDALIAEHGQPVLVIIDTLSRNFGAGDESSTRDMAAFVQVIDRDLRSRYGTAVLTVHHTGLTVTDRGRGSSALWGALDFEYLLVKNQDGTRTLCPKKTKDHEAPPELAFRAEPIELPEWTDPDTGDPLSSLVMIGIAPPKKTAKGVRLSGAQSIAFRLLNDLILAQKSLSGDPLDFNEVKVPVAAWREACCRGGISEGTENSKLRIFRRAARDLLNLNVIKTLDGFYWVNNEQKDQTYFSGQTDKSGHCPDLSARHQSGRTRTHPYKGCPVVRLSGEKDKNDP